MSRKSSTDDYRFKTCMFCKNGDLWISRKYCSAQDLGGFEKISQRWKVKRIIKTSKGDGRPIGKGFLAYPENMKFGVRVSAGQIGE